MALTSSINNNKSLLYIWNRYALFFSHFIDVNPHKHHALQLTIAVNAPIILKVGDGGWKEYDAVVIGADVTHQMRGTEGQQIFLYFDRESLEAHKLKNTLLKDKLFSEISNETVHEYTDRFVELWNSSAPCTEVSNLVEETIQTLTGEFTEKHTLDPRIQRAITVISESPDFNISLEELSGKIYLSPSRLLHLFAEQVGIPIRQFILWRRISRAVAALTQDGDLTRAALDAGFSDLPHFSRTFSRMFGISPSDVLKNSKFVQVIPCQSA